MTKDSETGLVKFYDLIRGFGYLIPHDGGEDIRFFFSSFADSVTAKEIRLFTNRSIPPTEKQVVFQKTSHPRAGRPFVTNLMLVNNLS